MPKMKQKRETNNKTGIYRITNLLNNKRYIGLSKNIFSRWKQHTSNITDDTENTIIRRAFSKHGLRQQVNTPGEYGSFKFEVVEECEEEDLFKREEYYIELEQPEYNIQSRPPTKELSLKSYNLSHKGSAFLQYHNYELQGNLPGITRGVVEEDENPFVDEDGTIEEASHYISTKKSMAGNLKGAYIYLIIGISNGSKRKHYFLWSVQEVQELDFFEEAELPYNTLGDCEFILPYRLNNLNGFDEFKKGLGNFAFGLSSLEGNAFLGTLVNIRKKYKAPNDMKQVDFYDLYDEALQE